MQLVCLLSSEVAVVEGKTKKLRRYEVEHVYKERCLLAFACSKISPPILPVSYTFVNLSSPAPDDQVTVGK